MVDILNIVKVFHMVDHLEQRFGAGEIELSVRRCQHRHFGIDPF